MRLHERIRVKRSISLTPLIDVVFLLLVFFMLASTFLKFGTVKLETAGAAGGVADPAKVVLVHIEGAHRYRVNGVPTPRDELTGTVNRLVEQGVRNVIVVVREKASVDDLVQSLQPLRQSHASSIRIVE